MAVHPPHLLKYVSVDRIDIIKNLAIRFTQPSCFNDPFEARFCIEGLEDEKLTGPIVERIDLQAYRRHVLKQEFNGLTPLSRNAFMVCRSAQYRSFKERMKRNPSAFRERADATAQRFWDTVGIL